MSVSRLVDDDQGDESDDDGAEEVEGEAVARVFAPNLRHRSRIVPRRPRGKVDSDKPLAPMSWAQRLKRVFQIDIETCPDCSGNLRVIACIEDPMLIRKILEHVCQRAGVANAETRGPPVDRVAGSRLV